MFIIIRIILTRFALTDNGRTLMSTMLLRGAKRRDNLRGNENVFVFSNPLKEYANKGVLMFFQYGRLGSTCETEHISYVNILL